METYCECGKRLRSDNSSGFCQSCKHRDPARARYVTEWKRADRRVRGVPEKRILDPSERPAARKEALKRYHAKTAGARKSARAQRLAALDAIRSASGCVDCGFNEDPYCLDFDHVPERGEKLFQISGSRSRSWESVLAEIAKCDIVCANCHRLRTKARGFKYGRLAT